MVEWNPTDFHPIVPKKLQILDRLKPNKYRETQWSNSKVALTLRAFCITWERTEEETFLQNSVCRCTCLLRLSPSSQHAPLHLPPVPSFHAVQILRIPEEDSCDPRSLNLSLFNDVAFRLSSGMYTCLNYSQCLCTGNM